MPLHAQAPLSSSTDAVCEDLEEFNVQRNFATTNLPVFKSRALVLRLLHGDMKLIFLHGLKVFFSQM